MSSYRALITAVVSNELERLTDSDQKRYNVGTITLLVECGVVDILQYFIVNILCRWSFNSRLCYRGKTPKFAWVSLKLTLPLLANIWHIVSGKPELTDISWLELDNH